MIPSPKRRGGSSSKRTRKPKGCFARVWLSAEFVTWAKQEKLKPHRMADCILHTSALENGSKPVVIVSNRPDSEDMYEL